MVSVCGVLYESGEKTEITAKGSYYIKRDKRYLIYEEKSGDAAEITKNLVKFDDEVVSITKSGAVNANMVFKNGGKIITDYVTPYGNIKMGFNTKSMFLTESEEEINIQIKYALEMNGDYFTDCEIGIKITQQGEN